MALNLTQTQVIDLAKPFVAMADTLTKFYENPDNMKAFREWHLKKFGCEPSNEVRA